MFEGYTSIPRDSEFCAFQKEYQGITNTIHIVPENKYEDWDYLAGISRRPYLCFLIWLKDIDSVIELLFVRPSHSNVLKAWEELAHTSVVHMKYLKDYERKACNTLLAFPQSREQFPRHFVEKILLHRALDNI
jgi:hypothetical protein